VVESSLPVSAPPPLAAGVSQTERSKEKVPMTPEQAKFAAQLYIQGLENEYQITKKVIAAIPEGKKDYRPDPNARTAFELASHLASVDVWFLNGVCKGDLTPEGDRKFKSVAEVVAYYDKEFPAALAKVKALSGEKLAQPLAAFGAFNYPTMVYLAFTNDHSIHQRGQLAAYLRPMGSKVPNIYGGSFDEPMQIPASAH
jgi:uncharacterized damage-inducible protein DinB